MMEQQIFPFTAIVGQERLKLALLLNTIDPSLGGVLAIGDKGTGKTTLVRSLANLMAQDHSFPFVNLPIGTSEDSLLGQLSLGKLINEKQEHLQLGLLAKAHRGFLYIDEINLLNDYLMDMLLDAASMGYYFLEREGFSKKLDSQFCLIGSMNPEEGDLRPQLQDRFGLCVLVKTPQELDQRVEIIKRRLAFDQNPSEFITTYEEKQRCLLEDINAAQNRLSSIEVPSTILSYCAQLALEHNVEGLRADILLVKAAKAFAALEGRRLVCQEDVQVIQALVLEHRSNGFGGEQAQNPQEDNKEKQESTAQDPVAASNHLVESILPQNDLATSIKQGNIGKHGIATQDGTLFSSTSIMASSNLDKRKTVGQYLATDKFELKRKGQQSKRNTQLIFLLDSSGSMLQQQVVAYAKGILKKWGEQQGNKPTLFSLISLFDGEASVTIEETREVSTLLEALKTIRTGGKTDIVAGLKQVKRLTTLNPTHHYQLIVLSDGRFHSPGLSSLEQLLVAYKMYCKRIRSFHFVDTETDVVKIGWGKQWTAQLHGTYETLNIK